MFASLMKIFYQKEKFNIIQLSEPRYRLAYQKNRGRSQDFSSEIFKTPQPFVKKKKSVNDPSYYFSSIYNIPHQHTLQ